MTNDAWEMSTGELNAEQLHEELALVVRMLGRGGEQWALCTLGWGANLSMDRLWIPRKIRLEAALGFVAGSESAGEFRLGQSDITLSDLSEHHRFQFTHHGHLLLKTADASLQQTARDRWLQRGFAVFEKRAGEEWKAVPGTGQAGGDSEAQS